MNVLLGVSGSVAAYRAADLARELMRAGHTVRTCLTEAASRFVAPALFEALTGQPSLVGAFEEPEPGRMAHIDWARWADVVVVAPATASTLARLASGVAPDMLGTIALATEAPLVIAPAMNPSMLASEPVGDALRRLEARGAWIVSPSEGDVACGEHGQGKLAPVASIAAAVETVLVRSRALAGRRLLVTSGPTQEPIDDVRFLSNRSSGKMGAALARAGLLMGARVVVVAGPSSAVYPLGARVVPVRTAIQMRDAALAESGCDLIVGAAAVADYRPESPISGKIRRGEAPIGIRLAPNPDVIAELALANPHAVTVGFAAEPNPDLEAARAKLRAKGLAAIAANDVSRSEIGFDADENEIALVAREEPVEHSGRLPKLACALWLLQRCALLSPASAETPG